MLFRAGFDYRYQGLTEYIKNGHKYFNTDGHLLLGTGNTADLPEIKKIANNFGYQLITLKQTKPFTGQMGNYRVMLCELKEN